MPAPMSPTRAEFRVGDAQALPVGDDEFDAVVSGLVLNFVPDQPKAVAEMRRAARPGGRSRSMSGTMPARCS